MNRIAFSLVLAAPALALAACNVADNGNGSTTISVDENRIDAGADALANGATEAGERAADVIQNAGPELEKAGEDIQERAGRVADKVENIDVDVDLNTADDKPAAR